jgi:hypothetical protein
MLLVQNKELIAEVETYRESLNQPDAEDEVEEENYEVEEAEIPEDEKIIRSAGYDFVDLQNLGAPSGYYVINGVFSSRSNAINHWESTKKTGYPDSYLLLNKTNRFYYVIIYYANDDRSAINARKEYSKTNSSKVWVLEYFKRD